MDTTQTSASAAEDLPTLFAGCVDILYRCTPQCTTSNSEGQRSGATKLAILQLRLSSWKHQIPRLQQAADGSSSESSADAEAACQLLRTLHSDLLAAERTGEQRAEIVDTAARDPEQPHDRFRNMEAVTKQIRGLALQTLSGDGRVESKEATWSPARQKHLDRLIEDVTEGVDSLMQIASPGKDRGGPNYTPPREEVDVLSAFWLGVATSRLDSNLRGPLFRYAAEIVPGFSVPVCDMPITGGSGTATYRQGHTYNDVQASGGGRVVCGDQYGGTLFGEEDAKDKGDE